jgi:hypothetical protein
MLVSVKDAEFAPGGGGCGLSQPKTGRSGVKIGRVFLYLLCAVVGFLAWRYLITAQPLQFGANEIPETQKVSVVVYGYLVTLLGVLLGSAYRELQARKERGDTQIGNISSFAKSVALSIDLWISLCGSPIVYALLWRSLDGGNVAGLTVIALQNGFCCTMVISNFLKRGPQALPEPRTN